MWTPLSSHPWQLKERYGAVVIGSGYGGSITAARLAAAGHSVCLLERGKEWIPGRFPDDALGIEQEVRTGHNPLGLYDFQPGHDLDVFSGSGLGGTSLINANVAIHPSRDVFQHARWPRAIQDAAASGELDRYFEAAEEMLGVEDAGPYGDEPSGPAKVEAQRKSAKDGKFSLLRLAVNRRKVLEGHNHHGVFQRACTYCGDCVTGCNVGAKNTLYMNYLPVAKKHGAEIYTQLEVDFVLPAPPGHEGYFVFARHHPGRGLAAVEKVLHARVVVLAAGSLGSTGILLRSRDRGLSIGRRLGHHFSSNGDQLGLGYNNDVPTNVLGFGARPEARATFQVGPTIMSVIDYRHDKGRGYIIEEGAIPRALVDVARKVALLDGDDTDSGFRDKARELARIVKDTLRAGPDGALNHSMVYLGMGHDGADGRVVLDPEGRPRVIWGAVGDRPIFQQLSDQMRALVAELGGTYVKNPRWTRGLGHNPITVHPLGGCPMGEDADHGAVSHGGAVFQADGTPHAGLFVADGSVIPTSLAVNPFLTISAISERIAHGINAGLHRPLEPRKEAVPVPAVIEPPAGLEFTEKMRGFMTRSVTTAKTEAEYRDAEKRAYLEKSPLEFRLTIILDDMRRFIDSKEHEARCEGFIDSPLFGKRVLVEEGTFNLFLVDDAKRTKRMLYKLKFTSELDGKKYLLDGYKEIRDDPGFDVWEDNTTLFTSIRAGWEPGGEIVAQGVIHVLPADFLKQLTTFRVRNSPGAGASVAGIGRFGSFFFGELWESYIQPQISTPAP